MYLDISGSFLQLRRVVHFETTREPPTRVVHGFRNFISRSGKSCLWSLFGKFDSLGFSWRNHTECPTFLYVVILVCTSWCRTWLNLKPIELQNPASSMFWSLNQKRLSWIIQPGWDLGNVLCKTPKEQIAEESPNTNLTSHENIFLGIHMYFENDEFCHFHTKHAVFKDHNP